MIMACWSHDAGKRPSFEQIVNGFDDLIEACVIEDDVVRKIWKELSHGQVI
jgi:hypothetical protein